MGIARGGLDGAIHGPTPQVSVLLHDDHVVVTVTGDLDDIAATDLHTVCEDVLRMRPARVELDLSDVTAVGTAGVMAVRSCLRACRELPGGVTVTVRSTAGRIALLESMALV